MAKTGKTARPTTGPLAVSDLTGRIERFSLFDVFELLSTGRRSGMLRVTTPMGEGRCVLNRGHLMSASIQRLVDGEAAIEMLAARKGGFAFSTLEPTEAEGGLDLTSLLYETVRLEDEFERNSAYFPDETTRLGLSSRGVRKVSDDLHCGAPQVLEVIANKPRITTPQLLAAIPLASLKIRLAVAWLSSSGILGEYHTQAIALLGALDAWYQKLMFLGGGASRILLAASPDDGPEDIFHLIATIATDAQTPMPQIALPHDGPGVVRLRPPSGGLLSLTILPVQKRNRGTFQNIAASAQVVAIGSIARTDEGLAWVNLIPETTALVAWDENHEGPDSLRNALKEYADSKM